MNKIRNKKEIKDSILRGLNEALEFVKGARKSSDFRVYNSELNEKRKDGLPLKPRNSKKAR
ncbi:MAG: hypothetical protein NTY74_10885 [Ignavibacteriae bacterium]|nr:hypothetical protein [Ignavibacteriota bacterium]